jgi:flagellar biosynthesis protein FlhF
MRIKSYFADTVQEAIEKARAELGPDAMLMNSKKTDFELRLLGVYEVVFGVANEESAQKTLKQKGGLAAGQSGSTDSETGSEAGYSTDEDLSRELAELRRQIETVKRSVTRQQRASLPQVSAHAHPGAEDLCARLMAADFSEDLAQEIAEAAELRAFSLRQPGGRPMRDYEMLPSELLEVALKTELDRRIRISPELGVSGEKMRIVMLAGPAGAGKTTALIKLALRYGMRARLPMHLLSLDTLRVGGWEELASYARIAGLGFDAVHNWKSLGQVLTQQENKRLILIDTPGIGSADAKELEALSACCDEHGPVDVHIVCPATLRASIGHKVIDRFRPLRPSKLLLTHTDEAESAGSLLELPIRSGLPLSYWSTGQNIPEDIQEASKDDLLNVFSWRKPAVAMSAA